MPVTPKQVAFSRAMALVFQMPAIASLPGKTKIDLADKISVSESVSDLTEEQQKLIREGQKQLKEATRS
jgi:hypothetical protein